MIIGFNNGDGIDIIYNNIGNNNNDGYGKNDYDYDDDDNDC